MKRVRRRFRPRGVGTALAVSTALTLAVALPLSVRAATANDPPGAEVLGVFVTPSPAPAQLADDRPDTGDAPTADLTLDVDHGTSTVTVTNSGPAAAEGVVLELSSQGMAVVTLRADTPWTCERGSTGWVCVATRLDAHTTTRFELALGDGAGTVDAEVQSLTGDPWSSDNQVSFGIPTDG